MDNTIVDTLPVLNAENDKPHLYQFKKPDQIPGIFRYLPPLPDAIDSIYVLSQYYDMYILSTAPWQNPSAWEDKISWLNDFFGNQPDSPFYKKIILTHQKNLNKIAGAILLDDRPYHGAHDWDDPKLDSFWLQYGHDKELVWSKNLVNFLIEVAKSNHDSIRDKIFSVNNNYHYSLHQTDQTFKKESWE